MKTFSKAVLGSLMLAGTAIATAAPAEARVGVAVNLGLFAPPVVRPAYVLPESCYGPGYYLNCTYPVYSEPVFWNGYWYPNARYRIVAGHREFWINRGWHEVRVGPRGWYRR